MTAAWSLNAWATGPLNGIKTAWGFDTWVASAWQARAWFEWIDAIIEGIDLETGRVVNIQSRIIVL